MYQLKLDSGRIIRAGLATSGKHGIVRLIEGDQVEVRISLTDPSRGQITKKL